MSEPTWNPPKDLWGWQVHTRQAVRLKDSAFWVRKPRVQILVLVHLFYMTAVVTLIFTRTLKCMNFSDCNTWHFSSIQYPVVTFTIIFTNKILFLCQMQDSLYNTHNRWLSSLCENISKDRERARSQPSPQAAASIIGQLSLAQSISYTEPKPASTSRSSPGSDLQSSTT